MTIVKTEDTLGGKPRLEGRRISVLQIAEMVIDVRKSKDFRAHENRGSRNAGKSPERVADELEIGLDEVHEALAYYRNIDEMNELRERIKEKSNAPEKAER